jgi:polyhydroxybutyrate depolymerase
VARPDPQIDDSLQWRCHDLVGGETGAADLSLGPPVALSGREGQVGAVERTPRPAFVHQEAYSAAMSIKRSVLALSVLVSMLAGSTLAAGATPAAAAVSAQPSAGCQQGTASFQNGESVNFSAAGEKGLYIVEGPSDQAPGHPLPLVIDLHGYSEPAAIQAEFTQLGSYGVANGFITVTPQVNEAVQHWVTTPGSSDQKFLIALIGHLASTLCIDSHRVFVAGYSNGAFMASALACSDAGKVAAVATVAGIEAPSGCHPSRRVPVIAFHGTADPFVPYKGGIGPAAKKLPAPTGKGTIGSNLSSKEDQGIQQNDLPIPVEEAHWAARNGCSKSPKTSTAASGVTLIAYSCPNNATVELYRENGDGHIWAGSEAMVAIASLVGKTTFSISATQLSWKFFESHPL